MQDRLKQIKYYTNLLKDNEILLLKSVDSYFNNHYDSSPLGILTNFKGSEGEAIIDKNGKITIFVDTRYHILVDKQVYDDIDVYKMALGESFFDAIKNKYSKNTVLYVSSDISLNKYLVLDKYFDLRRYDLDNKYLKNSSFNKKEKIFLVDSSIEKMPFDKKVEKIKKAYCDVSKMLIFNLDHIAYLTNLRSYQMENSSNFRSILFLDFEHSNHVLFSDKISKKIKIDKLNFMPLDEFKNFIDSFMEPIFFNPNDITLENFLLIKKPKEYKADKISIISSIRPNSAIDDLQKSFEKLDLAIYNFRNKIKAQMNELELVELFEDELKKQGSYQPSFKTILAVGENSASIHYSEADKNKILNEENVILLDCGGYFNNSGFATDITRTFYFGKKPKTIHKKVYTNVLKTFLTCYMSNETNARKLDKMARDLLKPFEKDGFNFNHGLGHGIGTSVHQNPPVLSMISKDIIKPYQVHSIEPGLYGKSISSEEEFGVRIENCVYSDLNYNKISMSKFPFEELLIDYSLLSSKEKQVVKIWQENFDEYIRNI